MHVRLLLMQTLCPRVHRGLLARPLSLFTTSRGSVNSTIASFQHICPLYRAWSVRRCQLEEYGTSVSSREENSTSPFEDITRCIELYKEHSGRRDPKLYAATLFDALNGAKLEQLLYIDSTTLEELCDMFKEVTQSLAKRSLGQEWTPAEVVACAHQAARVAEYCTEAYGFWPHCTLPKLQRQDRSSQQLVCSVEYRTYVAPVTSLSATEVTWLRYHALQLASKAGCAVTRLHKSQKHKFVMQAMPALIWAIRTAQFLSRNTMPLFGRQWDPERRSTDTTIAEQLYRAKKNPRWGSPEAIDATSVYLGSFILSMFPTESRERTEII
eukprot:gb/GECG01006123.1/.p1 GENE.gb/GECG01006123.1/~~gb/GECG01006123.1/.p1  ORF type:complete len:326 (+),score=25.87 gb/GECG01006123.1/:1-978(+)